VDHKHKATVETAPSRKQLLEQELE
jgi:hypothetical protein